MSDRTYSPFDVSFKVGVIREVDYQNDTCTVSVNSIFYYNVPIHYHCDENEEDKGGATPFMEYSRVIVLFEKGEAKEVVGFADGVRNDCVGGAFFAFKLDGGLVQIIYQYSSYLSPNNIFDFGINPLNYSSGYLLQFDESYPNVLHIIQYNGTVGYDDLGQPGHSIAGVQVCTYSLEHKVVKLIPYVDESTDDIYLTYEILKNWTPFTVSGSQLAGVLEFTTKDLHLTYDSIYTFNTMPDPVVPEYNLLTVEVPEPLESYKREIRTFLEISYTCPNLSGAHYYLKTTSEYVIAYIDGAFGMNYFQVYTEDSVVNDSSLGTTITAYANWAYLDRFQMIGYMQYYLNNSYKKQFNKMKNIFGGTSYMKHWYTYSFTSPTHYCDPYDPDNYDETGSFRKSLTDGQTTYYGNRVAKSVVTDIGKVEEETESIVQFQLNGVTTYINMEKVSGSIDTNNLSRRSLQSVKIWYNGSFVYTEAVYATWLLQSSIAYSETGDTTKEYGLVIEPHNLSNYEVSIKVHKHEHIIKDASDLSKYLNFFNLQNVQISDNVVYEKTYQVSTPRNSSSSSYYAISEFNDEFFSFHPFIFKFQYLAWPATIDGVTVTRGYSHTSAFSYGKKLEMLK